MRNDRARGRQTDTMNTTTSDHRLPEVLARPARSSSNKDWLRAIELTASINRNPSRLLADVVQNWSDKQADRVALLSDRETLTFGALSKRINQYARWALANGVGKGDTVALLMSNRP